MMRLGRDPGEGRREGDPAAGGLDAPDRLGRGRIGASRRGGPLQVLGELPRLLADL